MPRATLQSRCSLSALSARLLARCALRERLLARGVLRCSLSALSAACLARHALRERVVSRRICGCALRVSLERRVQAAHALLALTPVCARLTGVSSAFEPTVEYAPEISARVDGERLALRACSIDCNEDAYCLSCELELTDADSWRRCEPGALLELLVGPQRFVFLVDSRSRSRAFPSASYTVSCRSAASRLDAPYAAAFSRTWTNASARGVAQELCDAAGLALDWRLLDWPLSSFAVQDQTPLDALATLKTEAARLLSDPDGGLRVQYRHPVSPSCYAAQTPELLLSDYDDIQELEEEFEPRPGYNAALVLDEQSEATRLVELQEWTGVPGSAETEVFAPRQRCVAVYVWPYLELSLRSHCDCELLPQGRLDFEYEETVEIKDGEGELRFAPSAITRWSWLCGELGAPSASGKTLTSALVGQGLLNIAYQVACQRFLVERRSAGKTQLWVELEETLVTSSPRIVRVARWPADREAPECIVDPLCTSTGSKIQRGRNYLDEQGCSKRRYEARTPFRTPVSPGAIALVRDASLGESFYAKVTGWRLSAAAGSALTTGGIEVSMVWDLERSV